MNPPHFISRENLLDLIDRSIEEDVGPADVTTLATVPAGTRAEASFVAKQDGILAGQHVAELVLRRLGPDLELDWVRQDGETIYRGTIFGSVEGEAQSILKAERLSLNLLQRMSGIATTTRRYVNAVRGTQAKILDTRKTAPGLRVLDKWSVRLGGGHNHRIGLFDMILIKDNHIAAAGGVRQAVRAAHHFRMQRAAVVAPTVHDHDSLEVPSGMKIEVEARTLDEVSAILEEEPVDMILLDNMVDVKPGHIDTSRLRDAVEMIDGRIVTEASGNVTLETVQAIAATGVDYISCGALTHSVVALDISLQMKLLT